MPVDSRVRAREGSLRFTGDLEVHQRGDGSWNWVLIERPDVHRQGVVLFDSTPYACASQALSAGDAVIRSWIGDQLPIWMQPA